jgi:four helix bundle protein
MALFDPERVAVYRLARQHNRAVHKMLRTANTRGFADAVNQLRRAAMSIPANTLEALGEWRVGKRLNYFQIAKGSAWESWAHTDSLVDFGVLRLADTAEVRELQNQITALLITSVRKLEEQTDSDGTKEHPPPAVQFGI